MPAARVSMPSSGFGTRHSSSYFLTVGVTAHCDRARVLLVGELLILLLDQRSGSLIGLKWTHSRAQLVRQSRAEPRRVPLASLLWKPMMTVRSMLYCVEEMLCIAVTHVFHGGCARSMYHGLLLHLSCSSTAVIKYHAVSTPSVRDCFVEFVASDVTRLLLRLETCPRGGARRC